MTEQTLHDRPARAPRRVRRHVAFRVAAVLVALVLLVAFGAWELVLTPWTVLDDGADHGWPRTPERHRGADLAATALMGAVGVAALLAAWRPRGRSGLVAWAGATLAIIAAGSVVSVLLQQHGGLGQALLLGLGTAAILAAPVVLLHPERRAVLRGGAVDPAGAPTGAVRVGLRGLAVAGVLLAAGVVAWRVAGGVFEDPREDDVVGLAMWGLSFALGGALCLAGRAGWRPLAWTLALVSAYAAVAAVAIVLT